MSWRLVKFLASFGTTFGATLLMGQEFMHAVARRNFGHPTCIFPTLRTAVWATMLTTTKSMEGYAKLLFKGDLQKVGTPCQAEQILLDVWKIIQSSMQGTTISWTGHGDAIAEDRAKRGYKSFGRLCIRAIHFMAKKKISHETEEIKTLEDITMEFTKALQG